LLTWKTWKASKERNFWIEFEGGKSDWCRSEYRSITRKAAIQNLLRQPTLSLLTISQKVCMQEPVYHPFDDQLGFYLAKITQTTDSFWFFLERF